LGLFKPLSIPFPEEKPDFTQTAENTSTDAVIVKWLTQYKVPAQYWDYWRGQIIIAIISDYAYPAGTWEFEGKRYMNIRPEYLNPGVIAHEMAHCSYGLMSTDEKFKFAEDYGKLKDTNAYIKLLYSINTYGLTNDVEAHAELYRYLAPKLPLILKGYYPKLY
jgi:hypothetical protein